MGVREQIIFPEIDYDAVDQVRGLDVTITTTAPTDAEAFALLEAFGMPFTREGNPYAADRRVAGGLTHGQDVTARAPGTPRQVQDPRVHAAAAAAAALASVYRKFGVCRICLRELAHNGYIPGMTKSSW